MSARPMRDSPSNVPCSTPMRTAFFDESKAKADVARKAMLTASSRRFMRRILRRWRRLGGLRQLKRWDRGAGNDALNRVEVLGRALAILDRIPGGHLELGRFRLSTLCRGP